MGDTPSLKDLAADAMDSLSNLCESDDDFNEYDALSDLDKVRVRYKHADCDDFAFALNVLMDWPVVCAVSRSQGPIHRLVQVPEGTDEFAPGTLVDVDGYTSETALCKRYKAKKLTFVDGAPLMGPTIQDDSELRRVIATIKYLPFAPFTDAAIQRKVDDWLSNGYFFEEEPPTTQRPTMQV